MELNITEIYYDIEPSEYSASAAEQGVNVAKKTWDAAMTATHKPLKTPEEFEAFREWVAEFGAWEEDEINGWGETECNALMLQFISGDIRETCLGEDRDDWDGYDIEVDAGGCASNIFRGDNGQVYFQIN